MTTTVDTCIFPTWIVTVNRTNTVLNDHCVVIDKGKIKAILPAHKARQRYLAEEEYSLNNQVLIPGLINLHTHAAMTLFRGLADDLPLMAWLKDHIWPAESRWVDSQFVKDGTQLAIAEMIRSGTTCFNDMYFFPSQTARVATASGIRATVGLIVLDFPTVWANDANDYLAKGIELHDELRNNPLVSTAFAPHAPYTVSAKPLQKIAAYSDELDIPYIFTSTKPPRKSANLSASTAFAHYSVSMSWACCHHTCLPFIWCICKMTKLPVLLNRADIFCIVPNPI